MQQLRIVEVDPQGPDALALLREAAIEARALYPEFSRADAPWPTNPPTPDGGVYLVAYGGGQALACGAIRPLHDHEAEVRRMFVTRASRRRGLASAVLTELERRARGLGYAVLKLETGYKQLPAIHLYESQGYRRIEPFGDYADDPTSVCFEKTLCPEPGGPAPARSAP